jgi:nicotinamidase-related amidase
MSTHPDGEVRPAPLPNDTNDDGPDPETEAAPGEGDSEASETLRFVLSRRPDRVQAGMLAATPPEFRERVRQTHEAIAALALCEQVAVPSIEVRARLVDTIGRRVPRRALLVIDMIHDHLDPDALLEVPRARAVVPALRARLETAREQGIPVIYVVDEHEPDDPDLLLWGEHAIKGSRGTEVWDPIAPEPGDRIVKKPSYSAFFESELATVLDELAVDTLVLTGCLTEIGIMATATEGMQRGYAIEVPPDSQAGSSPELEATTMATLRAMAPFGPARKKRLERLAA